MSRSTSTTDFIFNSLYRMIINIKIVFVNVTTHYSEVCLNDLILKVILKNLRLPNGNHRLLCCYFKCKFTSSAQLSISHPCVLRCTQPRFQAEASLQA